MPVREPITLTDLSATIERLVLGNPNPSGRRLLGIEYERLLLHVADSTSAPLKFCRDLLARLGERFGAEPIWDRDVLKGLRADGFELSMEPGGQLEVACAPVTRLAEVEAIMQRVDAVILDELAGSGVRLSCVGHAPVTPVEEIGLLPRDRYRIMDARMPERGALTRNMMRATAGFQLTYDIDDRADAARKLALLYRLTPVLVALAANSRQVAGRDTGYASFRHMVWWDTDSSRSCVPAGCLHAETAIDGYVRFARQATVLFTTSPIEPGVVVEAPPNSNLEQLCERGLIDLADIELHLSSLFPFVRLRNYVEVRCLDSIEWSLARSMLALLSGIVYCSGATARAEALSDQLVVDGPDALRELHLQTARFGLDARAPSGATMRGLARSLTEFAAATIGRANCDWASAEDLDEVRARIAGRIA